VRTIHSNRVPRLSVLVVAILFAFGSSATAAPPQPIPEGPEADSVPKFIGSPATPRPISGVPQPPRHPFMAPNGRSNIHNDAYMTDTYLVSGPLGRNMERISTFQEAECASVTFDSEDRIVSICVGLEGPRLVMLDPTTLEQLASFPLPPRSGGGNPFSDFSGGGYFYLDNQDRAVIPTNHRHLWVVGETSGPTGPGFALVRDYDLSLVVPPDDKLFSVLPDWSGLLWFVSQRGTVGTVEPAGGGIKTLPLGEQITNSFAVDDKGGVYIVTDKALYRFDAADDNSPEVTWRRVYRNSGIQKTGQVSPGSGTTPTLMGSRYVAITDNADPMFIEVFKRAKRVTDPRLVCVISVFFKGASATDNSLIGTHKSLIVENNYGYTFPTATMDGRSTTPGIVRVDMDSDGEGCHRVWRSEERAPSVVPKLSLGNGLVYTYTKPEDLENGVDSWYLTALDFRTGRTVYKRLAGTGLGFNNNYAPVSIGPDGTAYVGVLGGLVLLRDRPAP
jgi:hypothetical protein